MLKPDEGTADLPAGRVRLCIDADKTTTEVDEEHVHRVRPLPTLIPTFPLVLFLSVTVDLTVLVTTEQLDRGRT